MFRNSSPPSVMAREVLDLGRTPQRTDPLPQQKDIENARRSLISHLPEQGLGASQAIEHIKNEIALGFNSANHSSTFFGFVTGGITPAASIADHLVTAYDQNVQVHLPRETIATEVEDRALSLLCELLDFKPEDWTHQIFTTGATASNILGLACAREHVIRKAAVANGARDGDKISVGEYGLSGAMKRAGVEEVQVLTTVPHSSLSKAASVVGLGRGSVKLLGVDEAPHRFDMAKLKSLMEEFPRVVTIVAVSAAEVNTGLYATDGLDEMKSLRDLCDTYGAWLHVDAAFGIMGRLLTSPSYSTIYRGCSGLELADSITGDCHKLLNVPYDCGFFLSRDSSIATDVFQNPNAVYLATTGQADIPSPLNIGLENSRRFRALPVYATLVAYGRNHYRDMVERQVELARGIAKFVMEREEFELLPASQGTEEERLSKIFVIVLLRAKDEKLNGELVQRIKDSHQVYVSGTQWEGKPACRFAISHWDANLERDLGTVKKVLFQVLDDWLRGPQRPE